MADQQLGHNLGYAACSIGNGTTNRSNLNGGTGAPDAALDIDNADNIATARARLATIDANFYSATRLNSMTYNDMIYALRVADNSNTIRQ